MTLTQRNDSPIRQYRPPVGKLIKMSQWADYTARGLSPWSYLRVLGIDRDTVTVRHAPNPTVPAEDGEQFTIPLYTVDAPVGWEPRYTIHAKPEQAKVIVKDWFSRGIVVRQSHDMSGSMPKAFQPLTSGAVPGSPHWQFCEDTDVITAEDCPKLFRVIAVTEEEITSATLGYPADKDCKHCQGTGRRSVTELATIRHEAIEVTRARIVSNEDYAKLETTEREGKIPIEDYRAHSDTFRCHCHYGALGRLGRTKRGKLFSQMRADGWEVKYFPYAGGYWRRWRETIVHDWQGQ